MFLLNFFFFIENILFYILIIKLFPYLSRKQRSNILSIKSASILFIISLLLNFFINNEILSYTMVTFFSGYLLADLIIGQIEYKEYIDLFTGYIHHSIYIFINFLSIVTNLTSVYSLFFISELPTILLSIGRFNSTLRNDYVFGILFFTTRIVYHTFLIYNTLMYPIVSFIGILALCVHIYWFKGWYIKYIYSIKN